MIELNTGEIRMEFNKNITDAARQVVRTTEIQDGIAYDIPGYKGSCVAVVDTDAPIQPVEFFTEGNRRYAVGSRLK
jgi:hypothetical protein